MDSPGLSAQEAGDDVNPDLIEALSAIQEALPGYEHAKEYDSINVWEGNVMSREGRTVRQSDIEFDPNFCGVVIDSVNNKLKITSVTATSGDVDDKAATEAATAALNAGIWEPNKLQMYYRTWLRNTCRDGDGYLVVWPSELDDGTDFNADTDTDFEEADDSHQGAPSKATKVNVTYADPRLARMFYNPENPREKRYFAQAWQVTLAGERKPRTRLNLTYTDRIEKYLSKAGTRDPKPADFEPFFDPDHDDDQHYDGEAPNADGYIDDEAGREWPMPNPYGVIPAFHLRTDLEYGKPIHRNAFGPQDAVSRIIEMQMVTIEFQGYPQRYAIQEADSLGTQSIREDPLADSSPQTWDHDFAETSYSTTTLTAGVISNETGSNYEANPGGLQVFKNFREVGSFSSADPNAFLEPWREYCKAISSTTGTPLYKFAGLGGEVPSGEALKIIDAPLIDQVTMLFEILGDTLRESMEFGLLLLGITAKVTITWANPATTDLMDVWELVQLKVKLGVPLADAFMGAGIPEQQAQEWADQYAKADALAAQEVARAALLESQAASAKWAAVTAQVAAGVPQPVALVEAGYDEETVLEWIGTAPEAMELGKRVTLLGQITGAAQQLGAAVTLGVMTTSQAQSIIIYLLGDVLPADQVPPEDPMIAAGLPAGGADMGDEGDGGEEPDDGSEDAADGGDDVGEEPDGQPADDTGEPSPDDDGSADRQADAQYEFVG
jgi:hypothetical protein